MSSTKADAIIEASVETTQICIKPGAYCYDITT